jgi:hypothetical protein
MGAPESNLYRRAFLVRFLSTILKNCGLSSSTLKVYDDAMRTLTENGRPTAFREFLLDAPHLFTRLGEQVGFSAAYRQLQRFHFGRVGECQRR